MISKKRSLLKLFQNLNLILKYLISLLLFYKFTKTGNANQFNILSYTPIFANIYNNALYSICAGDLLILKYISKMNTKDKRKNKKYKKSAVFFL